MELLVSNHHKFCDFFTLLELARLHKESASLIASLTATNDKTMKELFSELLL